MSSDLLVHIRPLVKQAFGKTDLLEKNHGFPLNDWLVWRSNSPFGVRLWVFWDIWCFSWNQNGTITFLIHLYALQVILIEINVFFLPVKPKYHNWLCNFLHKFLYQFISSWAVMALHANIDIDLIYINP